MVNKVVGPYIIQLVELYNEAKSKNCPITVESLSNALMCRPEYRMCLEANYPELYNELKETDFLYLKRD